MPIAEKGFVIKHSFKNVSSMKEGVYHHSNIEEHFGIPWYICVIRKKDHLGYFFFYQKEKSEKEWTIEFRAEHMIWSVNGKSLSASTESIFRSVEERPGWGWPKFITWEDMMKYYVTNDTLNVELHVTIKKMTGVYEKNKLINFDESNKPFSDVVLVVEDQKFYVSKLFLANRSTYFNSLLFGNFKESQNEEVTLNDIGAADFQNFLEVLYGEPAIDDFTVTGILWLADMYDTKRVIEQCHEFLMGKSELPVKEKLELAIQYNFDNLKNKCLLEIKTIDDIRLVLPGDLIKFDHTTATSLLQKAVSLRFQELFLSIKRCFLSFFEGIFDEY